MRLEQGGCKETGYQWQSCVGNGKNLGREQQEQETGNRADVLNRLYDISAVFQVDEVVMREMRSPGEGKQRDNVAKQGGDARYRRRRRGIGRFGIAGWKLEVASSSRGWCQWCAGGCWWPVQCGWNVEQGSRLLEFKIRGTCKAISSGGGLPPAESLIERP